MLYITIVFLSLFLFAWFRILKQGNPIQLYPFNLEETLSLRGFLAVCVFLTHLCPHLDEASPWLADFGLWGPPSVATFFLLTGYGLAYSVKTKGKSYLQGFFRKRLMKLLWPFYIMTAIYQGYNVYINSFSWTSLLQHPFPMSWFIYALLIWYVGFYLCFKNVENYKRSIVRIWMFTIIYMVVTILLNLDLYWVSILPLPMAITYVFYEEKAKYFICKHPYVTLSVITLLFIAVMGYTLFAIYVYHLPGWGPVVYTTLPIWVVFITYILGGVKNVVTNFMGSISYEFYIIHGFVVMLLADMVLVKPSNVNSVLVILSLLGLTTVCAWGMNEICKKIKTCI